MSILNDAASLIIALETKLGSRSVLQNLTKVLSATWCLSNIRRRYPGDANTGHLRVTHDVKYPQVMLPMLVLYCHVKSQPQNNTSRLESSPLHLANSVVIPESTLDTQVSPILTENIPMRSTLHKFKKVKCMITSAKHGLESFGQGHPNYVRPWPKVIEATTMMNLYLLC